MIEIVNYILFGILIGVVLMVLLPIVIHRCVKAAVAGYNRGKQQSSHQTLGEDPSGN